MMVCGCDGVEGELEVDGVGTLCLPKFKVKFKIRNGGIFMFHANKVLHCIMVWHLLKTLLCSNIL
jgi:hypothetical protein